LIDKQVGNVNVVATFEPGPDGLAKIPVYDRLGTVTGRMTVTSGPNILTLKKEYRGILESLYGRNGCVAMLDFSGLEARVLLYEAGGKCEAPDVYEEFAKKLGRKRDDVKGAIISELFGIGKQALEQSLEIRGEELDKFLGKIKELFKTKELLKCVKAGFVDKGYVTNKFGRRIEITEPLNHIMVNYYAQSTGADVVLLGFSQVVKSLAKKAPGIRPLFLLHDALFLDVPNVEMHVLKEITSVKVHGYRRAFPLKLVILQKYGETNV
jgi:hypothetical protein